MTTLFPISKPFLHVSGQFSLPVHASPSFKPSPKIRISISHNNNIKALSGVSTEPTTKVKDVITVKPTVVSSISLDDEIQDFLGQSLELEPISAGLDPKLQAWWTEIRTVGHADKKDEPWWPTLKTPDDLIQIITTMIWVTSGHHVAVNFGQYTFGGYFPNRPTMARDKMPTEDKTEEDWKFFVEKPELVLLHCFPSKIQAIKVMLILDTLSSHSPGEEYLGKHMEQPWAADPVIKLHLRGSAAG
ncbi:Lipoxygenase [Melia azedarach]|uniref:Lipoxygenase n=1 Tax=Melia azedarach TaxID=155640 RepID=A0ACC1YMA2_MELAZ|nr:Lipoxygenase [Melia azedarach]